MASTAGPSHFCLTNDQKRWLVAGIALNKILVPQMRSFVEQEVGKEYNKVKSSHTIHTQTIPHYLKAWPTTSKDLLKYENINGNDSCKVKSKKGKCVYDYNSFKYQVTSHVDFARLFVQNFMAKFTAFDDHCDASAVLQLLLRIPAFSPAVQTAADKVRMTRNDWAHCGFSKWDQPNFSRSFSDMEQLVKSLALSGAGKILGELKDWETKGTALCQNSPVDPLLLQLVQQEVNFLQVCVDNMCVENEEDKTKVTNELRTIDASLEEMKKRVENLECDVEVVKGRLDDFEGPMRKKIKRLESNQQSTDSRVELVEDCMTVVDEKVNVVGGKVNVVEDKVNVVENSVLHLQEQVQDLAKTKGSDGAITCAESPKPADYPDNFVQLIRRDYKNAVLCPFPWCEEELEMEFSKMFTKLKIVGRKKERARLTKGIVEMKDVFSPHIQCEKPRVVLIEGPPGMGKTTYSQKLAYDWSVKDISLEPSFPKVDMLLRLNCRDMKTTNIEDAIDDQLLPRDANEKEKEDVFHFIRRNQSRILLVLDGLDELSQDLFEGLLPLIKGRVFANTYLLLTARHEAGMKVRKYCDTLLEIVGYTSADAESYIKKYFSNHDDPSLAKKLISSLDRNPKLSELSVNPLNTALLCLVCEDSQGKFPHNRTLLYRELVSCVLRRYFSSKKIVLGNKCPIEHCSDQLNQLGRFALDALLKDQLAFSPWELKSQSTEFLGFGFLSREASASKLKPKATYAFTHKTFQEYFAAFHLAHDLATGESDKVALLAQLNPIDNYWQVWEFLISMAATESYDVSVLVVSSLCACYQQKKPESLYLDMYVSQDEYSDDNPWDSDEEDYFGMGTIYAWNDREEDYSSESQQDDDELDSDNADSGDVDRNDGSDHRFDNVIVDVCRDASHDWVEGIQARWLFRNKSEVRFCEAIIHTIAQCEKSESQLSRNQIKMADTLARCFPLEKMIVDTECSFTLTPQYILILFEYLKCNSQLKDLSWCVGSWDELSSAAIGCVLQSCHELKRLYLINDLSNPFLTSALQTNRTVTHLKLSSSGTFLTGAKALGGLLQSNHTLTHLCLAGNHLTHIEAEALAQGLLSNSVLVYLDLSVNCIGDQGTVALSKALESNRMLKYLDVSFQNQGLSRSNHMESDFLGDEGTKALAHALRSNNSLTYLDLQANLFTDSAAAELGESLQFNSSLTHLYLRNNCIPSEVLFGNAAATAFSKALQSPLTQLTRLDLHSTSISSSCAVTLAEALQNNRTLERLDLSDNKIECSGAIALAQTLKSHQALQYLQLRNNKVGDSGAKEFVEALQYNETLLLLDLIGNPITKSGAEFILGAPQGASCCLMRW
ncbi:NACHT, LRR and PYD domains-containing protein 3-like isoform X1 [Stylophora pistillata]|uniref:NACHT, LRR and PYD domains-containing protein 3-like isoform X1 n=1 Tax=Stylophora pistillata TaxID=50429 RepID=UPI000C04A91B|nr:NACHT, LRR and PYD domains-containing protein 3-like isoform X1 [Stylophora pistillata]XP_022787230.1 NACHT, LRR and PYD domains-containing protein 3-like isoform X1 [Stylophora pistillata]